MTKSSHRDSTNKAYINSISTAVPEYECNVKFLEMLSTLVKSEKDRRKLSLMARNSQIEKRYSVLSDAQSKHGEETFYRSGQYPTTEERMNMYEQEAIELTAKAVEPLVQNSDSITHLIVTSCTGFYAPGLDIDILKRFDLKNTVERTMIGFMGCNAAINGLRGANYIVRSRPDSRVLLVNTELCSLHLQENAPFERLVSYLLFADGCAASVISCEPNGIAIEKSCSVVLPDSHNAMSWHIGDHGYVMTFDNSVAEKILSSLSREITHIIGEEGIIDWWSIHGGGRKILDASQKALGLRDDEMRYSRDVLRNYGNMSSATVMFALKNVLEDNAKGHGCAMSFGPGLTLEAMTFQKH